MAAGDPRRILVLSSRPDIVQAVAEAASAIEPRPEVRGLFGKPLNVRDSDLILVDIAEPRATIPYLRRRFGGGPALVALVEGAWIDRLGSALAEDWTDYLFYPLNADELGLVWEKHTSSADAPELTLDCRRVRPDPRRVSFPRPVPAPGGRPGRRRVSASRGARWRDGLPAAGHTRRGRCERDPVRERRPARGGGPDHGGRGPGGSAREGGGRRRGIRPPRPSRTRSRARGSGGRGAAGSSS